MTKNEANLIIENYKPHKGFFDLSKKPERMSDVEYAKTLKTQNFLAKQNEKREYLRKFDPIQWDKLCELSVELQNIILSNWGDSIFS